MSLLGEQGRRFGLLIPTVHGTGEAPLNFGQISDELGPLALRPHDVPPLLAIDDDVPVHGLDEIEDYLHEPVLGQLCTRILNLQLFNWDSPFARKYLLRSSSDITQEMPRNNPHYLVGVGVEGGAVSVIAPGAGPHHVAELPAPDEDALDRAGVGRQAGDEPPLPARLPPDFAAGQRQVVLPPLHALLHRIPGEHVDVQWP